MVILFIDSFQVVQMTRFRLIYIVYVPLACAMHLKSQKCEFSFLLVTGHVIVQGSKRELTIL